MQYSPGSSRIQSFAGFGYVRDEVCCCHIAERSAGSHQGESRPVAVTMLLMLSSSSSSRFMLPALSFSLSLSCT